jgi:hypothetical protein
MSKYRHRLGVMMDTDLYGWIQTQLRYEDIHRNIWVNRGSLGVMMDTEIY